MCSRQSHKSASFKSVEHLTPPLRLGGGGGAAGGAFLGVVVAIGGGGSGAMGGDSSSCCCLAAAILLMMSEKGEAGVTSQSASSPAQDHGRLEAQALSWLAGLMQVQPAQAA